MPADRRPGPQLGHLGEEDWLTRLGDHGRYQRVAGTLDVIDESVQHPRPLTRRRFGPRTFVEAAASLGNRALHLGQRRGGDICDVAFVSGVLDADHIIASDPPARDITALLREDSHQELPTLLNIRWQ